MLKQLSQTLAGFWSGEMLVVTIFTILMFVLLAVFLYSWLKEPRRLINGIFFTLFLGALVSWLAVLVLKLNNTIMTAAAVILFVAVMLAILLVMFLGWALLLWNAVLVWKRESHTLANMLTLFLALILMGIWVINLVGPSRFLPQWLNSLLGVIPAIGLYMSVCSYNYLLNALLYQFVPRNYRQDYLIVLGAGLIEGHKVSRLLGSRIDRAITYAKKQQAKGRPLPKIVFSGGQGADEQLSEAQAMADYAVAHGWSPDLVVLEDQSKNTLQNMQFSKKVIAADYQGTQPQIKFFTNNYHTFRAGLYARMAGLKANGVGSKVRLYFLPNALIREFVAVFLMNKRRHFIIISGLIILAVLSTIILAVNGSFK